MKILIGLIMILVLVGCDADNSPFRPTSGDSLQPPKIYAALDLVKNDYDFSGVSIRVGNAGMTDGVQNWGTYYNDIIIIDELFLSWAPIEKIACVMVHELNHHFGGDYDSAKRAGVDCYLRLK